MRIIAGTLGGRVFDSPGGHRTHPMSDKMRGAIFNALGDIEGLTVLDAFAGSGAVSFEAISRGAKHAVAIDIDKIAHKTMIENIQQLGLEDKVRPVMANATTWGARNYDQRFDIVLADPPYDRVQELVIDKLSKSMARNGTLVLSWPGHEKAPVLKNLKVVAQKSYGDSQLIFYKSA